MAATLEQQLADLCAMHGLTSIEISFTGGERPRADVYVRRGGRMQSDRLYGPSIAEAFADALTRLNGVEPIELTAFGSPALVVAAHEAGRLDPDPFYTKGTEQ